MAATGKSLVLSDVTAVPPKSMRRIPGDSTPASPAGIYGENNALLTESILRRRGSYFRYFEPAKVERKLRLDGQYIYGGFLSFHYGHFLLESLSRLYFAKQFPEIPLLFLSTERHLKVWQREILSLLRVDNRIEIITQPSLIQRLHLPEPGFEVGALLSESQKYALGQAKFGSLQPDKHIWLSRSKLKSGAVLNEEALENRLRIDGWIVIHPEEVSIQEQVDALAGASKIAGFAGSAFHTLALFEEIPSNVLLFSRTKKLNDNFALLGHRLELNQKYVEVAYRKVSGRDPSANIIVDDPGKILNECGAYDTRTAPDDDGARGTVRFFNELSNLVEVENYLEVGVATGKTFCNLKFKNKVAVDPLFRFNAFSYADTKTRFFEMQSDLFFCNYRNALQEFLPFHLIFLDGLHTAEQTFRDFCNSLDFADDDTVWIIDDTFPSDVYSLLGNQKDAESMRRKIGNSTAPKRSWQGDVFKVPLMIHDFFPLFDYATTFASGKGQTVVWRSERRDFSSRFTKIEEISRLGYLEFIDCLPTFNIKDDFKSFKEYFLKSRNKRAACNE